MKRVYIVVEGQTEQEFVNSVISPYLQEFGIQSARNAGINYMVITQ